MQASRLWLRWTGPERSDQSPEPLVWTVEGDSDTAVNRIDFNRIDSFVALNRIVFFSAESPITTLHMHCGAGHSCSVLYVTTYYKKNYFCSKCHTKMTNIKLVGCLGLNVTLRTFQRILTKFTLTKLSMYVQNNYGAFRQCTLCLYKTCNEITSVIVHKFTQCTHCTSDYYVH